MAPTLTERTAVLEDGQKRIESAVSGMTSELREVKNEVSALNVHAPKLFALADAAPALVELALAAQTLVILAKEKADLEAAQRVHDVARLARKRKFWWFQSDDLRVGYILASVCGGGTLLVLPHIAEWIQHLWK